MGRKKKKWWSPYLDGSNDENQEDEDVMAYDDYYSGNRTRRTKDTGTAYTYYQGGYGYSYNYDNFDWGRFGYHNTYSSDLNENKLYVKKPQGYATPDKYEIAAKLRTVGHVSTETNENLVGNLARFFYYKLVDEPEYFKEEYLDPSLTDEKIVAKATALKQAMDGLWGKQVPGHTPLEQAVAAFAEMANRKGDTKNPLMIEIDKLGEGLINIKEDVFRDAIYNDLLDKAELNPQKKLAVLQKLSLIQDFGTEFKVEKETIDRLANNSRLTAQRMMKDYSQLHMVEAYQRLLPNYQMKLLHKDLVVKVHIDRIEQKQKIVMLVDYSGSMNNTEKQEWVMALMVDRLKYVIKGEAEIYFSYFVCEPGSLKFSYLHDAASAMAFWKMFSTHPNGGGTNIGRIINYIGEQIRSGKFHNLDHNLSEERPEVLIINDGQDSIHTDNFTYKTNALTIMEDNDQLKDLCRKNAGKYIHITPDRKVVYS